MYIFTYIVCTAFNLIFAIEIEYWKKNKEKILHYMRVVLCDPKNHTSFKANICVVIMLIYNEFFFSSKSIVHCTMNMLERI